MTPLVVLHSAQSRLCSYLLVKRQDARYVPLRRGERKGRYSGSHLDIMKVNRRLRYQRSQAVLVVRHVLDKGRCPRVLQWVEAEAIWTTYG